MRLGYRHGEMKILDKNWMIWHDEGMRNSYVTVGGEYILVDDVEFVDIQEDFMGYDLMTFNYKGEEYTSYVTLR